MKMFSINILIAALLVSVCIGCSETEKTSEPQAVVAEKEAPSQLAVAPRVAQEPEKSAEPMVPKAEIDKAARLYAVLHAPMSEEDRQKTVDTVMEANGWNEESYQELLYDIAQDPASRAAYISLVR